MRFMYHLPCTIIVMYHLPCTIYNLCHADEGNHELHTLGPMGRLRNNVEQVLGPMGRLRNNVEQEFHEYNTL